jgi:NAD(P)-dependent dehydrogenase (short-subunit alcohol dehydrogenase family)
VALIRREGGIAEAIKADVSISGDVDRLFNETKRIWSRVCHTHSPFPFFSLQSMTNAHIYQQVDIVIVNAALLPSAPSTFVNQDEKDFDRVCPSSSNSSLSISVHSLHAFTLVGWLVCKCECYY